jgi:DoxX-like family
MIMRTLLKKPALLWILQALLALMFIFAGGMKLVLPLESLAAQSPLPGGFIRFVGVAEVLGAFGLILPELLRIQRRLTPLAAAGLTILMAGATVLTLATASAGAATIPVLVGLLAATVAYGRWPKEVRSAPTGQHPHAVR